MAQPLSICQYRNGCCLSFRYSHCSNGHRAIFPRRLAVILVRPFVGLTVLLSAVALLPLRMALMASAETLAVCACFLASLGHTRGEPLSPVRRRLVDAVLPGCCRVILLAVGFWDVRAVGWAPDAKICISNRVSVMDGLILYWLLGPDVTFVVRSEELAWLPFCGRFMAALRSVFGERGGSILLDFPEGASRGTRGLLPFKLEAFQSLEPVGLVALRYTSAASLARGGLLSVAGLLSSLRNEVEVIFVGTLDPPIGADPVGFADSARRVLSYSLGHEPDFPGH